MQQNNLLIKLLLLTITASVLLSCESETVDKFGESNAFIKFYGSAGSDIGQDLLETNTGDFVLLGTSSSFTTNRNNSDFYVVKTDNFGNEIWSFTYGDSLNNEVASQIETTQDGGFIIIGTKTPLAATDSDIHLIKIDSTGVQQWQQTLGFSGTIERGNSVQATFDGGYVIVGDTRSTSTTSQAATDMYISKLNNTGQVEWERTYGFEQQKDDTGIGVLEATNGDFIWFGSNIVDQGGQSLTNMRVVRSNNIGNLRWDRFYGANNANIEAEDIQKDTPGYILVGTATVNNLEDLIAVKIDESGDVIWQTVFSGSQNDEDMTSVAPLIGGGYAVAGVASLPGLDEGSFIIIYLLDGQGTVTSSATYGRLEEGTDLANSIVQTREGSFAIVGTVAFETNEMMCLIKIEPSAFSPIN